MPTNDEWAAELDSWGNKNSSGAIDSPLKLPVAASRNSISGSLDDVDSRGGYWSSTVSITNSRSLAFSSSNATMGSRSRAVGRSVRCLKGLE